MTAAAPGTEPYAAPTDAKALEEIQRVAFSLRKYTNDTVLARRIASAIVVEGGRKNIDPALLVGVVLDGGCEARSQRKELRRSARL